MRRGNRVHWGSSRSAIDPKGDSRISLGEAIVLFVSVVVWFLSIAAMIGALALAVIVTGFLVIVTFPCHLWSRFSPTAGS